MREKDCFNIEYEDMRKDLKNVECTLDVYLRIESSLGADKADSFKKNTSFVKKERTMRFGLMHKVAKSIMRISIFSKTLIKLWEYLKPERDPAFHRITKYRYMRDELVDELNEKNAVGLLEALRDNTGN